MHLNTFQYKMAFTDKCMRDNYQYYFSKNIYEVGKGNNKQTVTHSWQVVEAEKAQLEVKSTAVHRLFITNTKHINVFWDKFN